MLEREAMALPLSKEGTQLMSLCWTGMVTALFVSKMPPPCVKHILKLVNSKTKFERARKESAGG